MERNQVIGPQKGSKPRQILVDLEMTRCKMSEMSAIYRVKQYILNLIKDGELNGSKLPSNLSIARALNVKTDDVYDGIDELITEQVVTDNFEEGLA